jgi:hypothetical protein
MYNKCTYKLLKILLKLCAVTQRHIQYVVVVYKIMAIGVYIIPLLALNGINPIFLLYLVADS